MVVLLARHSANKVTWDQMAHLGLAFVERQENTQRTWNYISNSALLNDFALKDLGDIPYFLGIEVQEICDRILLSDGGSICTHIPK